MYFFGFKLDGPIAVGGRGLISGGGGGGGLITGMLRYYNRQRDEFNSNVLSSSFLLFVGYIC